VFRAEAPGRDQTPFYQANYPERVYDDFNSIPPVVIDSLLFIEDHDLLDLQDPNRNPAVEWNRFMLAVAGRIANMVNRRFREGEASTLATQIEKFPVLGRIWDQASDRRPDCPEWIDNIVIYCYIHDHKDAARWRVSHPPNGYI
jgi:membrane peptidoglycan carboxypeptidase